MDLDEKNETDSSTRSKIMCGVVEGFYGKPWTSEQRKDLFQKMKKWGMNSYLYAPKDDYKHRSFWRVLYTVEEAEHLGGLIAAAKENGIRFIYAISPGLDITYSSSKDISVLKRKLEQVKQLDCKDFAILFDDIESEMSKSDKEMFKSFGDAQVSISNELYQFLSPDKFLFCPTEYCAARAIPNVKSSEYLKTIGSKLDFQFDILWTGGKVVSKDISLNSIVEVAEVICRPPVLWDNLHANDYDQKRIFLGPYAGRSPELIQRIRGVLTNPNCEYGSNFVAIHTLAQWVKCSDYAPNKPLESMNSDVKLETENTDRNAVPDNLSPHVYHPTSALKTALNEWLEEFKKPKDVRGSVVKAPVLPPVPLPPPVATCSAITGITHTSPINTITSSPPEDMQTFLSSISAGPSMSSSENGSNLGPPIPLMNSLAAENKIICTPEPPQPMNGSSEPTPTTTPRNSVLEPMDTVSIPPSPAASLPEKMNEAPSSEGLIKSSSDDILMQEGQEDSLQLESAPPSVMTLDSDVETGTQSVSVSANSSTMQEDEFIDKSSYEEEENSLTVEDLNLLCDLFYLPYDHGTQGIQLLNEFQWLKSNANTVTGSTSDGVLKPEVLEWHSRARNFDELHKNLLTLVGRLNLVPNRELLYELYPYIWDIRGVVSLLNSYIKWLAIGQNSANNASIHGNYTCRQYSSASLLHQLLSLYNNRD